MPGKGEKYKENGFRKNFSPAKCAEHSIDNRPKEVEDRENFGHWELDTVKGGKNTSTECLFMMTERKSRNEIARKMPDAKGKSTVEVLDKIERKLGSEAFRRIFITMTCDGGTEFMDIEGIERSCIDGKQRTKLSPIRTLPVNEERTRTTTVFSDAFFLKAVTFQKSRMRKFPMRSTG